MDVKNILQARTEVQREATGSAAAMIVRHFVESYAKEHKLSLQEQTKLLNENLVNLNDMISNDEDAFKDMVKEYLNDFEQNRVEEANRLEEEQIKMFGAVGKRGTILSDAYKRIATKIAAAAPYTETLLGIEEESKGEEKPKGFFARAGEKISRLVTPYKEDKNSKTYGSAPVLDEKRYREDQMYKKQMLKFLSDIGKNTKLTVEQRKLKEDVEKSDRKAERARKLKDAFQATPESRITYAVGKAAIGVTKFGIGLLRGNVESSKSPQTEKVVSSPVKAATMASKPMKKPGIHVSAEQANELASDKFEQFSMGKSGARWRWKESKTLASWEKDVKPHIEERAREPISPKQEKSNYESEKIVNTSEKISEDKKSSEGFFDILIKAATAFAAGFAGILATISGAIVPIITVLAGAYLAFKAGTAIYEKFKEPIGKAVEWGAEKLGAEHIKTKEEIDNYINTPEGKKTIEDIKKNKAKLATDSAKKVEAAKEEKETAKAKATMQPVVDAANRSVQNNIMPGASGNANQKQNPRNPDNSISKWLDSRVPRFA